MGVPRLLGLLLVAVSLTACAHRTRATRVSPARLDVTLAADGAVHAVATSARGVRTRLVGAVGSARVAETDRLLHGLGQLAAGVAGPCGAPADAPPPVYVTVAPTAPWKHVLWVMQVLESPRVRLWRLRLRLGPDEAYVRADLPAEDVLEAMIRMELEAERTGDYSAYDEEFSPDTMKVRLYRKRKREGDRAFTRIRIGPHDAASLDLPSAAVPDPEREKQHWIHVDETIRLGRLDPARIGEIQTRPPDGPDVPTADVVRVLRMFRAAGYTEVRFEATTVPTTGQPSISVPRGPMGDS